MTNDLGEVLFEFTRIGASMRVTAVHAETGIEVTLQGPAAQSRQNLQNAALSKLRYVMAKKRSKTE